MTILRLDGCRVDLEVGVHVGVHGGAGRLGPRELALLRALVDHAGSSVPREQLLAQAWRDAQPVDPRAVAVAMFRLREKLEADPRCPRHLVTTPRGYRFVPAATRAPAPEREPFVGRRREVAQLLEQLRQPGVTTLVGPPGVGKTRLACHVAWRLDATLVGGAHFCDLSEARSEDDVALAVARSLEISLPAREPLEHLGRMLAARGATLLVLDECEQVRTSVAGVSMSLSASAPDVRLLGTSRHALDLEEEVIVPVTSLSQDAAEALFELLASHVRPISQAERQVVAELVGRLDRLPLAIYLAASRIGALSTRQILVRLAERFRLLSSAARDLGPRERTLLGAVDWSWSLLEAEEQSALAQAAIFRGGFDTEAADAVLQVDGDPRAVLSALVGHSLLELRDGRFHALRFIREYASDKLMLDEVLRRGSALRHAEHFAERSQEARAIGIASLRAELDNVAMASERAVALDRADLAGETARAALSLISGQGPFQRWTIADPVLAMDELDPAVRVSLLLNSAAAQMMTGIIDADERIAEASKIAEALGDHSLQAFALVDLGTLAMMRGDEHEQWALLRRAEQHARVGAPTLQLCSILGGLAHICADSGRFAEGVRLQEDRLRLLQELQTQEQLGDTYQGLAVLERGLGALDAAFRHAELAVELAGQGGMEEVCARVVMSIVLWELGELGQARAQTLQVVALSRQLGTQWFESTGLENLCAILMDLRELDASEEAGRAALALAQSLGIPRNIGSCLVSLGTTLLRKGELDEAGRMLARARPMVDTRPYLLSRALESLAELACEHGDLEAAWAHVDEAHRRLDETGSPRRLRLAELTALQGLIELRMGRSAHDRLSRAQGLAHNARPNTRAARRLAALREAVSL